MGCFK